MTVNLVSEAAGSPSKHKEGRIFGPAFEREHEAVRERVSTKYRSTLIMKSLVFCLLVERTVNLSVLNTHSMI